MEEIDICYPAPASTSTTTSKAWWKKKRAMRFDYFMTLYRQHCRGHEGSSSDASPEEELRWCAKSLSEVAPALAPGAGYWPAYDRALAGLRNKGQPVL
jgi:hypothetical protein